MTILLFWSSLLYDLNHLVETVNRLTLLLPIGPNDIDGCRRLLTEPEGDWQLALSKIAFRRSNRTRKHFVLQRNRNGSSNGFQICTVSFQFNP